MKNKVLYFVLFFFICLLPFSTVLDTVDTHDGYYRDGAIMMLQDHDWLVPKTAAGDARFLKPPLSYWTIALSFSLFGVDFFPARLPSMIAACGVLWLTYLFSLKLTNSKATAQFAVLVLFSNLPFILSSTYSLPDMWLCFFILLSMYGFVSLITFKEESNKVFWMTYGGAAGAVLSKGLLGVGVLLFAWIFVFIKERKLAAVRRTIHFPILFVAFLPIILWFIYITYTHGSMAWDAFFGDQVAKKVRSLWRPFIYVFFYIGLVTMSFLPWSLSCLELACRKKKNLFSIFTNNGYQFILSAILLMLFCFSLASPMRTRYMLPLIPLSSIMLAPMLATGIESSLIFSLRRLFKFILAAFCCLAVGVFLSSGELVLNQTIVVAIAMFVVTVISYVVVLRFEWLSVAQGLALIMMFSFQVYFMVLRPIVDHRVDIYMVPEIVKTLEAADVKSTDPILFISKSLVAPSLLRTSLHGETKVVSAVDLNMAQAVKYDVILILESESAPLVAQGYDLRPIVVSEKSPFFAWIIAATEHKSEKRKRYNKKYVLATRRMN